MLIITLIIIVVILPSSYGQGHLAFASGCDGTESELPDKDGVLNTEYGLSYPSITFQAPGEGVPQKKKGADKGSPQGQHMKLESIS